MENSTRTAAHFERMTDRRLTLRQVLVAHFPTPAEIVWEVGCGHGHFLNAYAARHPQRICVGVDITKDRIERALRKRNRARLENLNFVHAEARDFLVALPPYISLSEVFVLFPDPWPKRRHHKNRIIQSEFLDELASRAGQGAKVYFRTDDAGYFADAENVFRAHTAWELISHDWPFEHETVFQSRAASHHSLIARRRPSRA